MDFNVESPFSVDLGDELFPLPSLPCVDIPTPQLPSISPLKNNNSVSQKPKNGRRRNPPAIVSDDIDDENLNEHKKRKILHRDVERQRRQEMSTLYTTLRSLLPIEYLKGKRSICDHVQETVKYVGYMQSRIQQLSHKRDELKNLSNENPVARIAKTLNSSQGDSVTVRQRNESGGVQVVLDTGTQDRLPVSSILQALMAEGLEIISCISTKINDRFFHTIESQPVVTCGRSRSIDACELHHKLTNFEYSPLD